MVLDLESRMEDGIRTKDSDLLRPLIQVK